MALTRAVAGDLEQVLNTERTVTSALSIPHRVLLPAIKDGTGTTVAADTTITVSNNGTNIMTVMDGGFHNVVQLRPGATVMLQAAEGNSGDAAWVVIPHPKQVPSVASQEATGAGSALLGANSPAVTVAAPFKWLKVIFSDGSTGYIPAWK